MDNYVLVFLFNISAGTRDAHFTSPPPPPPHTHHTSIHASRTYEAKLLLPGFHRNFNLPPLHLFSLNLQPHDITLHTAAGKKKKKRRRRKKERNNTTCHKTDEPLGNPPCPRSNPDTQLPSDKPSLHLQRSNCVALAHGGGGGGGEWMNK